MDPAVRDKKCVPDLEKRSISWKKFGREERYSVLLASVFIYVLLSVLLPERTWSAILLDAVFFILVLSVVFEAVRFRSIFSVLGLLGAVALLGHGVAYLWRGTDMARIILAVSSILFIAAAILRVSRHVMRSRVVTGDTIRGAIIIYLLVGALFSSVYILIEIVFPGSFLITNSAGKPTVASPAGFQGFLDTSAW
jgi:hypothetical protein